MLPLLAKRSLSNGQLLMLFCLCNLSKHLISVSVFIICLQNYSSIISLHPEVIDGRPGTLVIESFVVDVPEGNTKDETCYFVEAVIKCNLKSLADVSERLAMQDRTEPIDRYESGAVRAV